MRLIQAAVPAYIYTGPRLQKADVALSYSYAKGILVRDLTMGHLPQSPK
jgi:hypothetical protein